MDCSAQLTHRIQSEGPITFAEFMRSALYDPKAGYYCRDDIKRWGREGDYRTSPERSELFAATFARYFARLYDELGCPSNWTILEAGSGGGDFARGVLETLDNDFPKVFAATRYIIDEISVNAQNRTRELTAEFSDRIEFAPIRDLRLQPGIVFSNELLDAFPVHRVTQQDGTLKEFYVDVNMKGEFEWLLRSPSTTRLPEYLDLSDTELKEGQIVEISLDLEEWIRTVSGSLKDGFVVSVDYGATAAEFNGGSRFTGTLRGFHRHSFVENVLADPGNQDLTATVNWTVVEKLGEHHQLDSVSFKPLDKFLIDEGLLDQLQIESRKCSSETERLRLSTDAREMILPDGMAAHFQVLTQRQRGPSDGNGTLIDKTEPGAVANRIPDSTPGEHRPYEIDLSVASGR